jgi:hypothetical protein
MKILHKKTGTVLLDIPAESLVAADLREADLIEAKLDAEEIERRSILPAGELVAWKKLRGGGLCKLLIPKEAKRHSSLTSRKCRAEYAIVLEEHKLEYRVGQKVVPDSYDPDPRIDCSHGIHFYITRQEAQEA